MLEFGTISASLFSFLNESFISFSFLCISLLLFVFSGSVRLLFGLTFLTFSISGFLLAKGSLFIPLIFLSSFTGLFMVLSLLSYASNQNQSSNILDLDKVDFLFIFLFGSTATSLSSSGIFLSPLEIFFFTSFLDSCLLILFILSLIIITSYLLLRFAIKLNHWALSFFAFLFEDLLLLSVLAILLSLLPAALRFLFSSLLHLNHFPAKRESLLRWSSDIYEVGVSMPGSTSSSFLFHANSQSLSGSFRFFPFIFLFFLLDLLTIVFFPLILADSHFYFSLLFLASVLLALSSVFSSL